MRSTTEKAGNMIPGLNVSRSYIDLLVQYQPRSVTTEHQAEEYQDVIDSFIDSPQKLTEDELEFMALLGELVSAWEDGNFSLPEISGVELVRHLLEANNLRQKDLVGPVFPSEGVASEVLRGKRRLTLSFVERLGKFFRLPPAAFL
jgi:HTH-type transcriptional regulator / antitoxin HigA